MADIEKARNVLPQRRYAETYNVEFWSQRWYVTVGYYEDRERPGEVFVFPSKAAGSDLDTMTRDCGILLSLCLQHGVSIDTVRHALTRNGDGSPSSIMGKVVDHLSRKEVSS